MKSLPIALLLLAVGLAGCTGGADADGDGVQDGLEKEGWATHTITFMDGPVQVRMTSDPTLKDTDGDGLTDHEELLARTNPREVDTDGDGLSDCQELIHSVLDECTARSYSEPDGGTDTDPQKADSDGGFSQVKVAQWKALGHQVNGIIFGDGLSDGEEVNGYEVVLDGNRTITVTSNPRDADTDGDGLEDWNEREFGGNPGVADTDGDGCDDGQDPWPSSNEGYNLGLQTLLLTDVDGSSVDVVFSALLMGNVYDFPADPVTIQEGQETDISQLDLQLDQLPNCNTSSQNPWTLVQIFVFEPDVGPIDTHSSAPHHQVAWNVRTDELRWTDENGAPIDGLVTRSGYQGTITFKPTVSKS